jgi:hypothetical protein
MLFGYSLIRTTLLPIPVLLFQTVSTHVLFLLYVLLVHCSSELFLVSYVLFVVN